MDASAFESVIDILGRLGWLRDIAIPIVIVLSLLCYFHYRAGTSYGFVSRLYTLLAGRANYHDGTLDEHWRNHKDLERFNAIFNFKAKSLKDAHRLIHWFNEYDLDQRKFARLKGLFDVEKLEIKKTSTAQVSILFLLGVTFFAAAVIFTDIALRNAALVRFNDDTRWLWLSYDQAYSVTYDPSRDHSQDWRLTKQNCTKGTLDARSIASATGLKAETVTSICNYLSTEEDDEYISGVIKRQTIFITPVFPLIYWIFASFSGVLRWFLAIQTAAYLADKQHAKNDAAHSLTTRPTDIEAAQKTSEIVNNNKASVTMLDHKKALARL